MDLTPETQFLIDFNVHQVPAALGLDVPPAAAAAMLGITVDQFAVYTASIAAKTRQTAESLLAPAGTTIDRLPVPPGGKILTLGDSITTYRLGYVELLRALLVICRPDDGVNLANAGQSGYTSAQGLEQTYTQGLAQRPDLVFIMYGVNDCKHFGSPDARTLVSLEEYRQNIAAIVRAFLDDSPSVRLVLLTPTPVLESVVNSNPDFAAMRLTWRNADIEACAEVVRDLGRTHDLPVVDLVRAFGDNPNPEFYLADGLHPGPVGHVTMAHELLRVFE